MSVTHLILALSVTLSSFRNVISKKTALSTDTHCSEFFFAQTVLFLSAASLLAAVSVKSINIVSKITVIYGIVYGILLLLSQWMLTLSLKNGNTSICSTVYSLGFILPTVSGALFWKEPFTVTEAVGLVIVVFVIILSIKKEHFTEEGASFVPFILIAMLASGGLGIMQKLQQSSHASEEKNTFLLIAFLLAFLCSFAAFLCCKKKRARTVTTLIYPTVTGVCFGGANWCNTILAGQMKSSVVFPLQNIGTVLLSTLIGIVIFKERITVKIASIIILSATAVIIFSI